MKDAPPLLVKRFLMRRKRSEAGSSTLEVIAGLILFALAATSLAILLPLTVGRASVWQGKLDLGQLLESCVEETRATSFAALSLGKTGWIRVGDLEYQRETRLVRRAMQNAQLVWLETTLEESHGLEGSYYDQLEFLGESFWRIDAELNFNWGKEPPLSGMGKDDFSVRWQGLLLAPVSGNYTFYIYVSDGARLWVNEQLLLTSWTKQQQPVELSGQLELTAGSLVPLRVEYYESKNRAVLQFFWKRPGGVREILPQRYLYQQLVKESLITVRDRNGQQSLTGRVLSF